MFKKSKAELLSTPLTFYISSCDVCYKSVGRLGSMQTETWNCRKTHNALGELPWFCSTAQPVAAQMKQPSSAHHNQAAAP